MTVAGVGAGRWESVSEKMREAFKAWWAKLATGQLKNRRYETFATLEIAEEAFMAGAEALFLPEREAPQERWERMRNWVVRQIKYGPEPQP